MGNKLFSHCLPGYSPFNGTAGETIGEAPAAPSSGTGHRSRFSGLCAVGQPVVREHHNHRHLALEGGPAAADTIPAGSHKDARYGADSTYTRVEGQFGSVTVAAADRRGGGIRAGGTVGEMSVLGAASVSSNEISFAKNYKLKDILGKGSTSTCYRCISRRTGTHFACKVIEKWGVDSKLKQLLEQFRVEIQVLQRLQHPNIIHMEDAFESDVRIHMVLELMQGGELFDYVVEKGTLSESEASAMVRQITSALGYMHSMNIIHRDLKPENLLLAMRGADPVIKIIDFGLAKIMPEDDDFAQSFQGTRGYLAPELLQRQPYSKGVDVWALGVIVFVLLCGCLPFDDDCSAIDRASAVQKFVLRFPKWSGSLSTDAKGLLSKLLVVGPKARLTAQQALAHPWVTGQAAYSDRFLESPRTLRKSPVTRTRNETRKAGVEEGDMAGAIADTTAEAHRRAEFEQQSDEYRDGGLCLGGQRPRKYSV